jgi:hypothetical protein
VNVGPWREAGALNAPLDSITVLLLVGDDLATLATYAFETAAAVPGGRRVAVFDLAGALSSGDSDGMLRALTEGRSLNGVAIALPGGRADHFLVPRGPGELTLELAEHERWPRLVEGFRSLGALLILTAPERSEAVAALAGIADQIVTLSGGAGADDGENLTAESVLAGAPTEDRATDLAALPARGVAEFDPHSARHSRRRSSRLQAVLIGIVVLLGTAAFAWFVFTRTTRGAAAEARTDGQPAVGGERGTDTPARGAETPASFADTPARVADTLDVPVISNRADSAHAAQWSVVLIATANRADATFRLRSYQTLPARTVSPVILGDDSALWFTVIGGAYADRTDAEALRARLRNARALQDDAGVVARLPLALRLDTSVPLKEVDAKLRAYDERGIGAYALIQENGDAIIYAGAFSTPTQAAVLYTELESAGLAPALAYRIGSVR